MLHWNSLEIQHPGVSLALVGNLTWGFNLRGLPHKLSVNKWREILWKTHTQKHTKLASCRPVHHTIVVLGALCSPCCLLTQPCCLARFTRWKQPAISSTSSGNGTKTNSGSAPRTSMSPWFICFNCSYYLQSLCVWLWQWSQNTRDLQSVLCLNTSCMDADSPADSC